MSIRSERIKSLIEESGKTYQELEKEAREYYDEQEEIESSYDYEDDYYEED